MNPVEGLHPSSKKCREPGAILDDKGNQKKFHSRLTSFPTVLHLSMLRVMLSGTTKFARVARMKWIVQKPALAKRLPLFVLGFFCTCVKP